jgi:hypothetical protein
MKRNLRERLSEVAKEFGATSFEEASEEVASAEEEGEILAPKQHVKRLISAQHNAEFQEYQGTTQTNVRVINHWFHKRGTFLDQWIAWRS